ncbi:MULTISPECIES: GPW/gp25 family protein [unclassified Novosphingobium]|uniref:GPW/gp25 family protein n=1 Tax=unclassified Novosphingobium TaxID=2644732 RepID=UPI00135950A3|nr:MULTISPECIES: GPW/gp25 family protein [unclassified Novosphingobium]
MTGMSRTAGTALDGGDHLSQSVRDILGTPIGTRAGRRTYGSQVPRLIDQPFTAANVLRIYAASALALSRWEDRLRVTRVSLAPGSRPGAATITVDGQRTDTPVAIAARIAASL